MKILHIGDVAGVPQNIAQAQRELGYKSDVLSYKKNILSGIKRTFVIL